MLNFVYDNKTTLIFGKGTQHEAGALLKPFGKKVLLHYGGGSIRRSGLYDAVTASLKAAGVEYEELGGVQPNPTLPLVYEGIRLCREHGLGLVLAVGGGSVIDSAKAIALGVPHEGDVWDLYLSKQQPQADPLPVATVLTIPAAGSESSPNTVITNEETRRKLGYGSPKLRPVFSIINPELFFTLPHHQMANGVSDMMSHIFERYFTRTLHTDLSDGLCETTLRTIMRNARILNGNLHDYDAWAEIAFSGNLAHNNLLGVGREQDWGCHAMEHELSALYHVDHGAGLGRRHPGMDEVCFPQTPRNVRAVRREGDGCGGFLPGAGCPHPGRHFPSGTFLPGIGASDDHGRVEHQVRGFSTDGGTGHQRARPHRGAGKTGRPGTSRPFTA